MDFWSRLLAGGQSSSPLSKKSPAPLTPEQRLKSFQTAYAQLVDKWRTAPSRPEAAGLSSIKQCLQQLTAILSEEARAVGPDLCREFAASSQIYVTISKIGASTQDDGLIGEVVHSLSKLVESEEELDFLGDEVFAISFMQFVKKVAGATSVVDISTVTETDLVELLFGIATKIRLHPHILPIWFSKAIGGDGGQEPSFAGVAKKDDFPLLYVMLHYIHHEGKLGDFARTGLLYMIESASFSEDLETWICESDLPTLMASGLGALYSQLSRKLYLSYDEQSLPLLGFSDDDYSPVPNSQSSDSEEFKSHMKTFLSHLLFWQDVLEHCKSAEVKQTMLDHFHVLFLQQLLYPSILESSDPGGGSAVAILTYLHRILDALDHPDLVHLILHYLLALPEEPSPKVTRRQKSMDLLTMSMSIGDSRPVNWFTLADLVLLSLKTDNPQVTISALRLVTVIIRKHHRYALNTLVKTSYEFDEESGRTVGAQDKEVDVLFSLIERIGGVDNFDELYEAYLSDAQVTIESHTCSEVLLGKTTTEKRFHNAENRPRELYLHALWHKDILLSRICGLLDSYFTNTALVNLHLTETIINLGACGYARLPGWLVVHYSKYLYSSSTAKEVSAGKPHETDEQMLFELNRLEQILLARRQPTWQTDALPPLLLSIHRLVTQVGHLRLEIPEFDSLLIERKQAFQISEKLSEAIASTSTSISTQNTPQTPQKLFSPSPIRPSALGSISQRIFSPLTTPRSGSPRSKPASNLNISTPTKMRGTPSPSKLQYQGSVALGNSGSQSPTHHVSQSRVTSPSRLNETNLGDVIQGFKEPRKRELRQRVKFPRRTEAEEGGDYLPPPILLDGKLSKRSKEEDSDESESESESEEDSNSDDTSDDDVSSRKASSASHERLLTGTASVSHVLTNAVILQHFLLELAALIQVRAATLGDVKFV